MKILFITPNIPYPPDHGGRMRSFAFLKNLAARHEIILLSFNRQDDDPYGLHELRRICSKVLIVPLTNKQLGKNKRKEQLLSIFRRKPYQYVLNYSHLMQKRIVQLSLKHDFDIVQVEFSQMGYYHLPPSSINVLDQHNVEAEILHHNYLSERASFRKLCSYFEWKKFMSDEIAICNKFSACLATSDLDKATIAKSLPSTDIHVIPNGVDSKYFQPDPSVLPEKNVILFTGTINSFPNTDGLKFFLKEIFPLIQQELPTVQFIIAGKNPPQAIENYARQPNITVTGYVKDMRTCFTKASAVVVPLRIGGGTRLKILEAMAMGVPVVSTAIGAEGLEVVHGENILIADEPSEFAQEVIHLIRNKVLQKKLVNNGRQLIETKYDWTLITNNLEQTYEHLLHKQA